jgi:hypothetical protein
MREIKLTTEELQKIQELRDKYSTITANFGQLKAEQIIINEQVKLLKELEDKFTTE